MTMQALVTDFDVSKVVDEWEDLVSAGQAIVEAHDRNRWALGDLGGKVERRYGEESLSKYASEINCRPSTLYDYTACSTFYNDEDRAKFPPLNWSHYREARRTGDHAIALIWLARAADEGWSVETLKTMINEGKEGGGSTNEKLGELGATFLDCKPNVNPDGKVVDYELIFRVSDPIALKVKQVYTLKVYGVKQEGKNDADSV